MLKKYFTDLNLMNKIIMYYFVLVTLLSFSAGTIYKKLSEGIVEEELGRASEQILDSIDSNIKGVIENANTCSKLILSNQEIQNTLDGAYGDDIFNAQINVNKAVEYTMMSFDSVNEVFIFDNYGHKYTVGNSQINDLKFDNIKNVEWYQKVLDKNGGYILLMNCNGDIQKDTNFISHIRAVNDIITQKNIGTLIVNIEDEQIIYSFGNTIAEYGTIVFLKDTSGETFIYSDELKKSMIDSLDINLSDNAFEVVKYEKDKYLLASIFSKELNCYIYSMTPYESIEHQSIFAMTAIIIIIIYSVFVIVGSIIISNTITSPVNELLRSMEKVKYNIFEYSTIVRGDDEIGRLKEGYNLMIKDIQEMISRVSENEEIKRKAELEVLQAQIKPHFLYNTMDMICSLALQERNKDVYSMLKALGGFYRTSLSNGKETINIREEIKTISNYLKIQQERYVDLFEWDINIEDTILDANILRLVLQPLVENSIYHGIRPINGSGTILVNGIKDKNMIKLFVEDNGVGMNQETIEDIMCSDYKEKNSIGLRGTIQRLRIAYGSNDAVVIESKPMEYTRVIITIPSDNMTEE